MIVPQDTAWIDSAALSTSANGLLALRAKWIDTWTRGESPRMGWGLRRVQSERRGNPEMGIGSRPAEWRREGRRNRGTRQDRTSGLSSGIRGRLSRFVGQLLPFLPSAVAANYWCQ